MTRFKAEAAWIYRRVLQHPLLENFLQHHAKDQDSIRVGWGYRPSGRAALSSVEHSDKSLLLLEDAFVRSLRPGYGQTVYGILADSCGIHYDANGQSDLLRALDTGSPTGWMRTEKLGTEDLTTLMYQFRDIGASKYNWFPGEFRKSSRSYTQGILIVDQTRGDTAIRHSGNAKIDFEQMLQVAFDSCEGSPIYLRAHPDHLYRSKTTCFSQKLLKDSRIHFLTPELSPAQCFSFCHTVMVGGSLMGMEALIHGKKVITFGCPFFAGRGLTQDFSPAMTSTARRSVTLLELFEAAYLQYCHYFDPDTGEPCGLGEILDHLELQKEIFHKNSGLSVTVGFSPWKRKVIHDYLRSPSGHLSHVATVSEVPKDTRVLAWGRKTEIPENLRNQTVWTEDGFIRSKGLGAMFNFPYSWVLDETGIYFDASAPSDLENLYNKGFDASDLAKSRELIQVLREKRLSKYNLDSNQITLDKQLIQNRKIILIPGQVDEDASILFGSPEVKSNLELLRCVREAEPTAFIIFKIHPDLVAGVRHGQVLSDALIAESDLVVTDGNVLDWLDICDEVHTMTSTVGFEALIRKVSVVTYGMPFYASWGLTIDRLKCERRRRELTLEELVCGALMKYPRYLNPATGEFTTALKVTHLLTSDKVTGDSRAWHLKTISYFKKAWVKIARMRSSH